MESNEAKPKVRVVKGQKKLKSGVIRIERSEGVVYRGPCDRCEAVVTSRKPPTVETELVCKDCRSVAKVGKPSTKVRRKGHKIVAYYTDCDLCGDRQKTPFLPKQGRPFLCDLCLKEERKEEEARREAIELAEAEAEALRIDEAYDAAEAAAAAGEHLDINEYLGRSVATPDSNDATTEEASGDNPVEGMTSEATGEPAEDPSQPRSYRLRCARCKEKVRMRFKPDKGEKFICPSCYEKEQAAEAKREETGGTRLLFQIECAACGKSETVNFVPKSLTESLCTDCFTQKRRH